MPCKSLYMFLQIEIGWDTSSCRKILLRKKMNLITPKNEPIYQEICQNIFRMYEYAVRLHVFSELWRLRFIACLRRGHVQSDNLDTPRV